MFVFDSSSAVRFTSIVFACDEISCSPNVTCHFAISAFAFAVPLLVYLAYVPPIIAIKNAITTEISMPFFTLFVLLFLLIYFLPFV